jgi:hypothetical protein
VICFEVAEHVPNPPQLVAELARLTARTGYCIFSEAFGLLKPQYPTHLASNLRYVAKADEMFREQGMRVAWRDRDNKPIVYTRLPHSLTSRLSSFEMPKRITRRIKRVFNS